MLERRTDGDFVFTSRVTLHVYLVEK